jgi:DNA-binding beta-propeller fold protein YncE
MKLSLLLVLCLSASASAESPPLRLAQRIPLPGVEGRIDHMAADLAGQRLFLAALGNNSIEVVDLRSARRARSVAGFREPQGVAWIAERHALFVASGGDKTCHVLDAESFAAAPVGGNIQDADNVRCSDGRVYVGCNDGALRIIDTRDWSAAGEIKLPAHPESFQIGRRIFVNVPAQRSVAVIAQPRVTALWRLENAGANFPMALDEERHRLLIGCRNPPALVVLDSDSGKEVARVDIGGDADDVFLDAKRQRVYVSCGAGFLDVIDAGNFTLLSKIATAPGARTSLFVPEWNRLYLAVPRRGDQSSEVRVYDATD